MGFSRSGRVDPKRLPRLLIVGLGVTAVLFGLGMRLGSMAMLSMVFGGYMRHHFYSFLFDQAAASTSKKATMKSAMGVEEACALLDMALPYTSHDVEHAYKAHCQRHKGNQHHLQRLKQARARLMEDI